MLSRDGVLVKFARAEEDYLCLHLPVGMGCASEMSSSYMIEQESHSCDSHLTCSLCSLHRVITCVQWLYFLQDKECLSGSGN